MLINMHANMLGTPSQEYDKIEYKKCAEAIQTPEHRGLSGM